MDAGDVVIADFPGVTGVKRRPAIVVSSAVYHGARPDAIIGLVTSQTAGAVGPTDCLLQDWSSEGLRVPSAFRAFLVTLPRATISSRIGRLSARDWASVKNCLDRALSKT